jgi:hypothetical protein
MAGNFIERSRHGTVFYFRRRVPRDLRERLQRSFIYVTLKTESRREALVRARAVAARTDELFEEMRAMSRDDDRPLQFDYTLRIDLDALTGKRKSIVFEDVKPGEGEEVARIAKELAGGGVAPTLTNGG